MAKGSESGEVRHMRLCEACGQVDDHPRHVIATRPGDSAVLATDVVRQAISDGLGDAGVAEALDNSTTVLHMDCCAERGCPTGTCEQVIERAGKKRGPSLTKALTEDGLADGVQARNVAPDPGPDAASGEATDTTTQEG